MVIICDMTDPCVLTGGHFLMITCKLLSSQEG